MSAIGDIQGQRRVVLWDYRNDVPVEFGQGGGLVVQEQALNPFRVRLPDDGVFRQVVSAAPCKLAMLHLFNLANSARYVRLYDRATLPDPATATPAVGPLPIPAADQLVMPDGVLAFATGLAIVISGGMAEDDTMAVQAGDVTGYLGVR